MIPDPTDEIKAIRDRLAAECDYDIDRIFEQTRRYERESGRTYLTSIDAAPTAEEPKSIVNGNESRHPTSP